ncbi:MAG: aspartate--ammonia ligase [Clostridia bacterium]|nr:aspartate--ammonia ligase [Clostridia bacterium]
MEYIQKLDLLTTQRAIEFLRHRFQEELSSALSLTRVSAPLFVKKDSGINDDLNGVERPVCFDVLETGEIMEVVHSLAKWKRMALAQYGFPMHTGLYTDMNAIRRDEVCDRLHSIYVDQWDWEAVIDAADRTEAFLRQTVEKIYGAVLTAADCLAEKYPVLDNYLPRQISFVTTYELEERYPDKTPKQREYAAVREYGAVFLMQIGDRLKSGEKHDGRAPDYDDWTLNGDLLVYNRVIDDAFELSSMGIRVDKTALVAQLQKENKEERLALPFHKALMEDRLPLSIGGGIGQSRLCMLLLQKAHIGEVHASVWPQSEIDRCKEIGAVLL